MNSKNTMKITLFFLITCILPLGVYAKQLVEFEVKQYIFVPCFHTQVLRH